MQNCRECLLVPQGVERELTAPQNGFLSKKTFCWAYLSLEAKYRALPGMRMFWQRKSRNSNVKWISLSGMEMLPTAVHTSQSSGQWLLNMVKGEGPRNRRFKAGHGAPGKQGCCLTTDQQPRWTHEQDYSWVGGGWRPHGSIHNCPISDPDLSAKLRAAKFDMELMSK